MAESTNFRPFTVNGVLNTDFGARTSKDLKKKERKNMKKKVAPKSFRLEIIMTRE